jgi:D-aminopeptidase
MQGRMPKRTLLAVAALAAALLAASARADAVLPFHFGLYPPGPLDGITDVPGVRVGQVTKVEGTDVRTGATGILPNGDPWNDKVAAAAFPFNGNGEMTGTHWINTAGFLEVPIVLTNTLNVGLADDGVVDWMIKHYPEVGVRDDVPLPVVAECDDQLLNAIQRRSVKQSDVVKLLDDARGGQFQRGDVGAGTGMRSFGFKGGIGSASRVLPASLGGYTVGVLVNDNAGHERDQLTIDGVPVGERLDGEYRTKFPPHVSEADLHGRAKSGSIIIVVATNAPLDNRELHAILLRAGIGMGRTGLTSDVSSGDLFIAFSTTEVFKRVKSFEILPPSKPVLEDEDVLDALYSATAEATQAAIYDALFEAKTMTGRDGITVYGLPDTRVLQMLRSAGAAR